MSPDSLLESFGAKISMPGKQPTRPLRCLSTWLMPMSGLFFMSGVGYLSDLLKEFERSLGMSSGQCDGPYKGQQIVFSQRTLSYR
jgi:hypothetical protein